MKPHHIAIVSPSSPSDIIATLTVFAKDMREALKRVRTDPDMAGTRCHPAKSREPVEIAAPAAPVEPDVG